MATHLEFNLRTLSPKFYASIRIGCTKSWHPPVWRNKQVSWVAGKMGNLFLPTHHYDVLFGQVEFCFVLNLAVEVNIIWGWKRNAEFMIIFKTVTLQRIWLVTGAKTMCARIEARLDLWNKESFDELVCYSYAVDTGYFGGNMGIKMMISVIIRSQTMFYMGYFARLSDSFGNGSWG